MFMQTSRLSKCYKSMYNVTLRLASLKSIDETRCVLCETTQSLKASIQNIYDL
jgi:hypothetical protein